MNKKDSSNDRLFLLRISTTIGCENFLGELAYYFGLHSLLYLYWCLQDRIWIISVVRVWHSFSIQNYCWGNPCDFLCSIITPVHYIRFKLFHSRWCGIRPWGSRRDIEVVSICWRYKLDASVLGCGNRYWWSGSGREALNIVSLNTEGIVFTERRCVRRIGSVVIFTEVDKSWLRNL